MTNKEYMDLFIESLSTKNKSEHTIIYYKRVLLGSTDKDGNVSTDGFEKFINKPFKKANKMDVLSFRKFEQKRGLKDSSINTEMLAIQAFFTFIIDTCDVKMDNPARKSQVKVNDRTPDFLSDDEVRSIINCSRNPLDRAIVMTFVSTGIRFSELSHLEYGNIKSYESDGETWGEALIIGKGNKERPIVIPPMALTSINYYYKTYRPETTCPYLFVNHKGNELDDYSIGRTVKSLAKKAGISNPDRLHPHLFRHTFATSSMRSGVDLKIIQSALGHSNISTTAKIYVHTDIDMLKTAAKKNTMFQGGKES